MYSIVSATDHWATRGFCMWAGGLRFWPCVQNWQTNLKMPIFLRGRESHRPWQIQDFPEGGVNPAIWPISFKKKLLKHEKNLAKEGMCPLSPSPSHQPIGGVFVFDPASKPDKIEKFYIFGGRGSLFFDPVSKIDKIYKVPCQLWLCGLQKISLWRLIRRNVWMFKT